MAPWYHCQVQAGYAAVGVGKAGHSPLLQPVAGSSTGLPFPLLVSLVTVTFTSNGAAVAVGVGGHHRYLVDVVRVASPGIS